MKLSNNDIKYSKSVFWKTLEFQQIWIFSVEMDNLLEGYQNFFFLIAKNRIERIIRSRRFLDTNSTIIIMSHFCEIYTNIIAIANWWYWALRICYLWSFRILIIFIWKRRFHWKGIKRYLFIYLFFNYKARIEIILISCRFLDVLFTVIIVRHFYNSYPTIFVATK